MRAEPELRRISLWLCDLCLDGEGGECHVPGCSLYLNRAPDLNIRAHCEELTDHVAIPLDADTPPQDES